MSFVNYTPSKERTEEKVKEAIQKYGNDIIIINGEDNFNACKLFRIDFILNKFKIEKLGDFHNQVSGISNSGCIIKKEDLDIFIKKFNKQKWAMRRIYGCGQMFNAERIKFFEPHLNEWKTFFEIKYGDTKYEKEKSSYGWYNCRHEATCTISNFKNCKKDVSHYFTDFNTQWYWHKVEKF